MGPVRIAAFGVAVAAVLLGQRASYAQGLQWERLSGSGTGAEVSSMVVDSRGVTVLLAAGGWVYRESGEEWRPAARLPGSGNLYVGGAGTTLALSAGVLFSSDDGAVQWRQLPSPDSRRLISAAIDSAGILWAFSSDNYGKQNTLFRSSDHGLTWTTLFGAIPERWELFVIPDGTLYAATVAGKLLRLKPGETVCDTLVPRFRLGSDGGEYRITYDSRSGRLYCCSNVCVNAGVTFRTAGYLQVSLDRGDTWTSLCPPSPGSWGGYLQFERIAAACPLEDGDITIAAGSKTYRTTDNGQTWSEHPVGEGRLLQLLANPQGMLYAGGKRGISRSSDGGVSWAHFNAGLTGRIPYAVLELSSSSLMLLGNSELHISGEEGRSWRRSFTGGAGNYIPYDQMRGTSTSFDSRILSLKASLEIRGALKTMYGGSGGDRSYSVISDYHSPDNGSSWICDTSDGAWWSGPFQGPSVHKSRAEQWLIRTAAGTLFQGTDTNDYEQAARVSVVRRSRDGGKTWRVVSGREWPRLTDGSSDYWRVGATGSGEVFAWSGKGMYRSTDEGESWNVVPLQIPVRDSAIALAVAGESVVFAATARSGLYMTMDGGASWNRADAGVEAEEIFWMLSARGDILLLGTSNGIYRALVPPDPRNIVKNPGFEGAVDPWQFYTNGSGTFTNDGIDDGNSKAGHVDVQSPGTNVQLYQRDLRLLPGTRYRLKFQAYSSSGNDVTVLLHKDGPPYTNYGLWCGFDLGTEWDTHEQQFVTEGFSEPVTDGRLRFWLAPFARAGDEYLFDDVELEYLGPAGGGGGTVAGIGGEEPPRTFSLLQNYPNPFNPSTMITFTLPRASAVRLSVFDVLGREVATLGEGRFPAGSHRFTFDASRLPSGVYIYRVSAGRYSEAKRMLLIR